MRGRTFSDYGSERGWEMAGDGRVKMGGQEEEIVVDVSPMD
jgi:hypothetical protein